MFLIFNFRTVNAEPNEVHQTKQKVFAIVKFIFPKLIIQTDLQPMLTSVDSFHYSVYSDFFLFEEI